MSNVPVVTARIRCKNQGSYLRGATWRMYFSQRVPSNTAAENTIIGCRP